MKIRMLSTQNGSLDGIRVKEYHVGAEYDLSGSAGGRDLAQAFVGARMAVEIKGDAPADLPQSKPKADEADEPGPPAPELEAKVIEAAPQNKVLAAPKGKGKK